MGVIVTYKIDDEIVAYFDFDVPEVGDTTITARVTEGENDTYDYNFHIASPIATAISSPVRIPYPEEDLAFFLEHNYVLMTWKLNRPLTRDDLKHLFVGHSQGSSTADYGYRILIPLSFPIFIRADGGVQQVQSVWIKQGGVLKECASVWAKQNGVLRTVF